MTSSALSLALSARKGVLPLPKRVAAILRKFGSDAHMFVPGPGVPILGSELAVNGGLDADTAWGKDQATISGGVASINNVGAGVGVLQQGGLSLVAGRTYLCSFSVNSITTSGGGLSLRIGGSDSAVVSSPGAYSFPVVYDGTSAVFMVRTRFAAVTAQFDNLSLKEILGYTNYLNGFAAGNYLESTGNTNASVDGAVGLVLDAAGSVGAELSNLYGQAITGSQYGSAVPSPAVDKLYKMTAKVNKTSGVSIDIGITKSDFGWHSGQNQIITANGLTNVSFYVKAAEAHVVPTVIFNSSAGTVTEISLREVTGTHATQATTANKPILRRGIVNLLTYSNDFTNAIWVKGGGNFVGDTFTATGTAQFYQTVSVTPGMTYTFAFKCRKVDMTTQNLAFYDNIAAVFIQDNVSYISRISNSELSIVTATVTVPAGCTSMRVYPLRNSGWTGESAKFESAGLFQGTLNAQQIIAAGGIPLTTTAPASSQYGAYAWQFDGSNDRLSLGVVGETTEFAVIACVSASVVGTGVIYGGDVNGPQLYLNSGLGAVLDKNNVGGIVSAPNMYQVGSPVVVSAKLSGGTGYIRKNGTLTNSAPTALSFSGVTGAAIGSQYIGTIPFNGSIYAVVAIKGTVSDSELRVLEKWLGSIAGVPIA